MVLIAKVLTGERKAGDVVVHIDPGQFPAPETDVESITASLSAAGTAVAVSAATKGEDAPLPERFSMLSEFDRRLKQNNMQE